jgi:hypothetical protein
MRNPPDSFKRNGSAEPDLYKQLFSEPELTRRRFEAWKQGYAAAYGAPRFIADILAGVSAGLSDRQERRAARGAGR